MPKVTSSSPKLGRHTIVARNCVTGLLERITPSKEIRDRFKNVGKPRKVVRPKNLPLIRRIDPEFQAIKAQEHDEDLARMAMLSCLLIKKHRLEDRIALNNTPAGSPLPVQQEIQFNIPDSLPQFKKTKILNRQEEYNRMLEATAIRLQRLYDRLVVETKNDDEPAIPHIDKLRAIFTRFDNINRSFDEEYQQKLTHSQWRALKRDLKRVGKIDMTSLGTRWRTICMTLVEQEDLFTCIPA